MIVHDNNVKISCREPNVPLITATQRDLFHLFDHWHFQGDIFRHHLTNKSTPTGKGIDFSKFL